jgi:hypothetical protein
MADEYDLRNLLQRSFTAAEARGLGVDLRQLRLEDLRQTSRGIYEPSDGRSLGLNQRLETHLRLQPDAWGSHRTAAHLHGLWLPPWVDEHALIHLSKPTHLPRVRRPGVVGHRVKIMPGEVDVFAGLRLSSPARTWLDLAQELTPAALIAVGDQLIRRPRPAFEGRSAPYATKGQLLDMLRAHKKVKGVGRCRDALADMRVGSDSVPETLLRLSLMAHGFPEPELQIRLDPRDPYSPSADQGYRDVRIALQYEGKHHNSPEQMLKDDWRDAQYGRQGWATIRVVAADLSDDFARPRRELRALMIERRAA